MKYIGVPERDDHAYHEPKTMADYVKEDYWYR
jgi:hypothetical protein